MSLKRLFLFTASYPYDNAETFIEDEIKYLSKEFDNIIIVPLYGKQRTRNVPANCRVLKPILPNGLKRYTNVLFCPKVHMTYIIEFFKGKVFTSHAKLSTFLISLIHTCNLVKSKDVKDIFSKIEKYDICYSYWGKGSINLCYYYRDKAKFVSRFHGEWDLWEETSGGYIPLREIISSSLDMAAFISQKGKAYFESKYPNCNAEIHRLGSTYYGLSEKSSDGTLRIVSCSTIYPLKRVDLIYKSLLAATDINIEWTHLGGGQDFDKLKQLVHEYNRDGLTVNLVGQIAHDDVIKYYKTHVVDLFVNLSTNEGIPVSIMEAISFGIPVIATDVGGTSEIVTSDTGILVEPDVTPDIVASAIRKVTKLQLNPNAFWDSYYNADTNYRTFAKRLHLL